MVDERDGAPAVGTWTMAGSALGVGTLLLLDLAVGRTYFGVNPPALAAGVAVAVALLVATRHLFAATLLATLTSLAISFAVREVDPHITRDSLLGRTGWPGMAEGGGLLLLVCWSLRALAPAPAMVAVASVVASFAALVEVRSNIGYVPLMTVVFGLGLGVAAGVGLYLRWIDGDRRRDLERVRQDERLAIARELHDVVAHYVTGIVVQAQAAREVWADRPEVAVTALGQIEAAGVEALGSMRRLVGSLRAEGAMPLAPAATLQDLRVLAERSAAVGLPVRLHLEGLDELPAEVAPSIHRVVGEAIANAQRHATGATGVDVRITAGEGVLTVEVVDDGHGSKASRSVEPGYGLTGMAERTEALGGTFESGPVAGGGWRIGARLPWREST